MNPRVGAQVSKPDVGTPESQESCLRKKMKERKKKQQKDNGSKSTKNNE